MQLAIIGDIHGFWDDRDTDYFNRSDYDAMLFVGDLPRIVNSLPVARRISRLNVPAWAIAGNHDAVTVMQLLAELRKNRLLSNLAGLGMARRVERLRQTLAPVVLGGYSLHTLSHDMGLLIARPHAMGPDAFYYRRYLRQTYGVTSFTASANLLKELVDRAPEDLLVLAHNGPSGLGSTPKDPFGCDFAPELGDFGDPDLRAAIDHARATGRRVRAVFAGHMHHRSKHSGRWRSICRDDGQTAYINAARVPRIEDDGARRHHVALTITPDRLHAEAVVVDGEGQERERRPMIGVAGGQSRAAGSDRV